MRGKSIVVGIVVLALSAGCSVDPEVAKREYFSEGNRYMEGRKYTEAILSYRNAVSADERFGEARLKLAEAYLATGDARNALREVTRAADLLPENMDAQLRAGSLLLLARQYPEARTRAVGVLAKEPNNPQALVLLGNALAGLKEFDGAIEQIERAIDEDPQLMLAYANLGALQVAKGDRDAAEGAFKRAIEAAPRSVFAHVSFANFLWAVGRPADAERELLVALDIEPGSSTVNRGLATLYLGQRRMAAAEQYLKAYMDASGTVESKLVLADYYVQSDKTGEAERLLKSLASDSAGYAPATVRLAALDAQASRRTEAHQKLDAVLAKQPKHVGALEAKSRLLLLEKRNDEALTVATALANANPQYLRGRYVRALALEATGATDAAVKAYEEMLATAPSVVPIQAKLAGHYLTRREFARALQMARQVVTARPQSADARLLYGQALLRAGDLRNAERELLMLSQIMPRSAEVHTWVGLLHDVKGDSARARRSFERVLELEPTSEVALAGLVSTDIADKKIGAALARIDARLGAKPNDPTLLMLRGGTYLQARDLPNAEATFRKVLELDANNLDAYGKLVTVYFQQKRLTEARNTFAEIAKRQARPVMAETMIGTILLTENKNSEARKHFERALQLNPRAAAAANNLAWDYANNGGNLDTALQLAQTAKAELPNNAAVTDTLGWVYYQKGLHGLAVTTLREAAKQSPSDADIHYRLGLAYLKNGNKLEARSTLQHVLKLNPQFRDAGEVRRMLASLAG